MTEIEKKPAPRKTRSAGGRKEIVITEDMIKEIEVLGGRGFNQEDLAAYFCMSSSAWYDKIKKYPEMSDALRRGKSKALVYVTGKLFEAIGRGDVSAIKYYLDRKGKWSPEININNKIIDVTPEKELNLKITVTDPIEASKIYQKIMTEN